MQYKAISEHIKELRAAEQARCEEILDRLAFIEGDLWCLASALDHTTEAVNEEIACDFFRSFALTVEKLAHDVSEAHDDVKSAFYVPRSGGDIL